MYTETIFRYGIILPYYYGESNMGNLLLSQAKEEKLGQIRSKLFASTSKHNASFTEMQKLIKCYVFLVYLDFNEIFRIYMGASMF